MKTILGLPTRLIFAAITVLVLGTVAVAGTVQIINHSLKVPAGSAVILTSACNNGSLFNMTNAPPIGSPFGMGFNCGGTTPAFAAANPGTVIPSFTLPTGFSGLSIVQSAATTGCTGTGVVAITPGVGVQFGTAALPAGGTTYNYCLFATAWPATTFTIGVSWAQ